jgi:two-component system sensor histidine kinase ChvG
VKLRHQLLLVSLLTLALPWAGWRYTLAMERAQRADRASILLENAALVERILSARLERLPDPLLQYRQRQPQHELSAHRLRRPILVDGFDNDWQPPGPVTYRPVQAATTDASAHAIRWRAGLGPRYLYLYVDITDPTPRYRALDEGTSATLDPRYSEATGRVSAPHDQLILIFDEPDGSRNYVRINPAAPGLLTPRRLRDDQPMPRLRAYWRAAPNGYAVEVRVPLQLVGDRFGFGVLDADSKGYRGALGTLPLTARQLTRDSLIGSWRSVEPGLLIRPADTVAELLRQLGREGQRLSVIDSAGWRIASAGSLATPAADTAGGETRRRAPVAGALLRWMLRREDAGIPTLDTRATRPQAPNLTTALGGEGAALRYRAPGDGDDADTVVLAAATPMRGIDDAILGAVLIEQSTGKFLTLTTPAFSGLMQTTVFASLGAALGLLGYATLLSVRIGRLRNAAERAADGVLRPGGRLAADIPLTGAGDELGDLARSFDLLLKRLRQQTEYLQSLASKLSHELRTPLTIVQSSLENLDTQAMPPHSATYLTRAAAGTERLRAILTAMSEATRLEQSIGTAEPEAFDLRELVLNMATAYRDVYADRRIALDLPPQSLPFTGVPELIVQLLDKLIDNAAGFSPPQGLITLRLALADSDCVLEVSNEGPALPDTMREQLFESMVSLRGDANDGGDAQASPHLGLGLYIARLIAEFHRGTIGADNLSDGSGAVFRVRLPRQADAHT